MDRGETASLTSNMEASNEDIDPLGHRASNNEESIDYSSDFFCNYTKVGFDLKSQIFLKKFFPNVLPKQWNDWRWQIKHSITDYSQLYTLFNFDLKHNELIEKKLPFRITPYFASVIYNSFELQKTAIPSIQEIVCSPGESEDPLHEDGDSPVPGLVHRYPDRVLFLATPFCSTNCRYCTRSRIVGNHDYRNKNLKDWDAAFEYIRNNKQIRDVVISGGDPLTLPDSTIEYILSKLRSIPHVEIIRLGTKVPAVLPMRITRNLVNILKKYHPLYMSVHFTHPDELTSNVRQACIMLANAGIPLGSQTVLLKDINDNPATMKKLFQGLLKIRVKPYYLYQCDPIMGSSHFRTSVEKGLEIIESLRGWTSGYAIPHYVIDAPGGGGKIPLLPEYYQGKDENGNVKLRNYENNSFLYPRVD